MNIQCHVKTTANVCHGKLLKISINVLKNTLYNYMFTLFSLYLLRSEMQYSLYKQLVIILLSQMLFPEKKKVQSVLQCLAVNIY